MAFFIFILTVLIVTQQTATEHSSQAEADGSPEGGYFDPATNVVTTGRIASIDRDTGHYHYHSDHRHAVASLLKNDTTHQQIQIVLKLDDESQPLHMELYPWSVWGPRSVLQARWGRHKLRFQQTTDSGHSCYFQGRATSESEVGTVTLKHCGRLTGHITTPSRHYKIAEMTSKRGRHRRSMAQTVVKVVKTRIPEGTPNKNLANEVNEVKELTRKELISQFGRKKHSVVKDKPPELTIEVALFADASYMSHLYDLGYDTTQKAQGWFIHKWNTIQDVYSDVKKVGVKARFKLVKMELWWYDPMNYPPPTANESTRLDWFCHNTPQGDGADQKILYTIDTGSDRFDSWSNAGKTCVDQQNCYLVKSPSLGVAIELHEMGHSVGLLHDNQMEGCKPPQGFMGPGYNYLFKGCYRKALRKRLGKLDCLYRDDFVDKENILPPPYWMELR